MLRSPIAKGNTKSCSPLSKIKYLAAGAEASGAEGGKRTGAAGPRFDSSVAAPA